MVQMPQQEDQEGVVQVAPVAVFGVAVLVIPHPFLQVKEIMVGQTQ
jgi:hypothetical protein